MWGISFKRKEAVAPAASTKTSITEKLRPEVLDRVKSARRTYEEMLREASKESSRSKRSRRVTSNQIREVRQHVLAALPNRIETKRQLENIDVGTSSMNTILLLGAEAEAYILQEADRIAHSLGASRPNADHVDLAVTNFVVKTLAELEAQEQVAVSG